MSIVLPALAVAFAAFCVWLTVRIINRRERWAKWTAVALLVGAPPLYLLSWGPTCWLASRGYVPAWAGDAVNAFYWPINWTFTNGYQPVASAIAWYGNLWRP